MELRPWHLLPDEMRTREVRKYYNILMKHRTWLKVKRVFDVIVSSIMLAVLIIPMGVIALAIKLDSPGPVFFRQARVTQYGRIFRIYKFRTMVDNASRLGSDVTVDNDVRITRVGTFLRKYRMDEFPQLFNILAGDMTLIGTRPEVPKYVKMYTPEMYATLLLPAGLTSRTSIAYKDEDKLLGEATDEKSTDRIYINEVLPAKMKYNLESMKRFGLKSDASVLWDTFVSVIDSDKMTIKKQV
ncbi:MAG: sugar transferase [Lachnospira sp.]|nr:sugar transferase [Lachnospira sp.]